MIALPDLQARWRQVMLQGDQAALPGSGLTAVIGRHGIAPEKRLGIHRNHLYITLREALAATFPTVHALVGAAFFDAVATRFIALQPPSRPCLFEYGAALPAFLAESGLAEGHAYLPDVARLDWAFNAVYHAEDAAPFDHAAFARLPPEDYGRLTFGFVPGFVLLRSDWPLAEIWQVTRPGAPADARVDLGSGPCRLAVHRDDWNVVWRSLSAAEAGFVAALQSGRMLAEAAAAAADEDQGFDLAALLSWAVQAGLFDRFALAAEDQPPGQERDPVTGSNEGKR